MSEELATVQQAGVAAIPNAQNLRILATDMFNSRMFKGIDTPAQAVAIIQMGNELGFPPVTALNIIKIIQGQMTVAARGLLALAQNKAGVTWETLESSDKVCRMRFSRPKWGSMEISFTLDEARAAGLVRAGGGWDKYPQDMLFARCASRGIRRIAPDAISGLYATEEIQDAAPFQQGGRPAPSPIPAPDAVIDAEEVGQGASESQPEREKSSEKGRPSPTPQAQSTKLSKFYLLKDIGAEKVRVGDERYYALLKNANFEHADQVPPERRDALLAILKGMTPATDGAEGGVS